MKILKKILKGVIRRIKNSFLFFISWELIDNGSLRKLIRFYEKFNLIPKLKSNNKEVIVSLTTYGKRFEEVHYTLFSLFRQKVQPDKIVLWLDEDEFNDTSVNEDFYLSKYIKKGLEVRFCENLKSYKKIIPSLELFPDSTIIICDDDSYYNKNWLALLLLEHKNHPNDILCHVGTYLKIQEKKVLPYKTWENVKSPDSSNTIVPIGVGGILVRKSYFYPDICNKNLFNTLSENTDDLWIWAQAFLKNTNVRVINNFLFYPKDFGVDRDYNKLYINNAKYGNDVNIIKILNNYPLICEKLKLV